MGKNSHKKKDKEDIGNVKLLDLSEDRLIDIQEEAYYRALKRIEEEKQKADIVTFETKEKSYPRWKLALNITFFPIKISKKYTVSDKLYENVLSSIISTVVETLGLILWIIGMYIIVRCMLRIIRAINIIGSMKEIVLAIPICFLAGTLVQAGRVFYKETDSNKIYAFSSNVIGIFGCIIAVAAILLR